MSPASFMATAVCTACTTSVAGDTGQDETRPCPAASGRSVEVRMQTAGKGCPTLVKKLDSSGRVPESLTTQKAFICKLVVVVESQRLRGAAPGGSSSKWHGVHAACGCGDGRSTGWAYRYSSGQLS